MDFSPGSVSLPGEGGERGDDSVGSDPIAAVAAPSGSVAVVATESIKDDGCSEYSYYSSECSSYSYYSDATTPRPAVSVAQAPSHDPLHEVPQGPAPSIVHDNKNGGEAPQTRPVPMNRAMEDARNKAFGVPPIRPSAQYANDPGGDDAEGIANREDPEAPEATSKEKKQNNLVEYQNHIKSVLADPAFAEGLSQKERFKAAVLAYKNEKQALAHIPCPV